MGVEVHHTSSRRARAEAIRRHAAPLCPSCHETYGANPTKRKFIREARDLWYEICERRYATDPDRLDDLQRALDAVATKEDLAVVINALVDTRARHGHLVTLANEVITELETARYQLAEAKAKGRGWRMLDMLPAAKFDMWQKDSDAVNQRLVMKALRGTYICMHRLNIEMQERERAQKHDAD